MTEGVFSDLGLDDVSSNPNFIPDGAYKMVLHDAKIFVNSNKPEGENRFAIFTYRIVDPQYPALRDNTIDVWKSANKNDDAKKKSFLKQHIVSLGVPENQVANVQLKALIGTPVINTVKNKDGYTNVVKTVAADDSGWGDSEPTQAHANFDEVTAPPVTSGGKTSNLDF